MTPNPTASSPTGSLPAINPVFSAHLCTGARIAPP